MVEVVAGGGRRLRHSPSPKQEGQVLEARRGGPQWPGG